MHSSWRCMASEQRWYWQCWSNFWCWCRCLTSPPTPTPQRPTSGNSTRTLPDYSSYIDRHLLPILSGHRRRRTVFSFSPYRSSSSSERDLEVSARHELWRQYSRIPLEKARERWTRRYKLGRVASSCWTQDLQISPSPEGGVKGRCLTPL